MLPARCLLPCLAALAALLLLPAGASAGTSSTTVSAPSAAAVALNAKGVYAITLGGVPAAQGRAALTGLTGSGLASPTLSGTARGRTFSAALSIIRINYDAAGRRLRLRARTLGGAIPGQLARATLEASAAPPKAGGPGTRLTISPQIYNDTPFTLVLYALVPRKGTGWAIKPADRIAQGESDRSRWVSDGPDGVGTTLIYDFVDKDGKLRGRTYVNGSSAETYRGWNAVNDAQVHDAPVRAVCWNDGAPPTIQQQGLSTWTRFTPK